MKPVQVQKCNNEVVERWKVKVLRIHKQQQHKKTNALWSILNINFYVLFKTDLEIKLAIFYHRHSFNKFRSNKSQKICFHFSLMPLTG